MNVGLAVPYHPFDGDENGLPVALLSRKGKARCFPNCSFPNLQPASRLNIIRL